MVKIHELIFISFSIKFYFNLDAKAAEAAASGTAYYDPNTHYAYVPPAYVRFRFNVFTHMKTKYLIPFLVQRCTAQL